LPAFYNKHVGGVVSFSINKYIYICVNPKFDGRIRVSYSKTENVDFADDVENILVREALRFYRIQKGYEITSVADIHGEGTGLGSSSAFTVGLVNALGRGGHPAMLAENAFMIEAEKAYSPVGKQDHYISAYGGMNYMRFSPRRVEVQTLFPKKDMEDNFLLLYTGITRPANEILRKQTENFSRGDTLEIGKKLAELAYDFRCEYIAGMEYQRMGEIVLQGWELKKKLTTVSTDKIDQWIEIAMNHGAYGGKLLGAGLGGFLFFIAPFETHAQIVAATGLRRVEFKIENMGSEVIYNG